MGTWSSSLYGNDTACDVKGTYVEFLEKQLSNEEAYKKTFDLMSELIGSEEEHLLWFALAETQWKVGRLTSDVKEKALYWIERKGGLEFWQEDGVAGVEWLKTLEKLKHKLEKPMPREKKIKAPIVVDNNPWTLNDVYAYCFNKKDSEKNGTFGKYMVLQKIGEESIFVYPFGDSIVMRIQIYDKIFDELPSIDDLEGLRLMPLDFPNRINISRDSRPSRDGGYVTAKEPIFVSTLIMAHTKSEYPKKHLTFLGNRKGLANIRNNNWELSWFDIDTWLYNFHERWHGIEYDTVGDGEYDYLGNLWE